MTGHYIDVNGLHLYYERHGPQDARNPPLVLLHGGFGATPMFTDLLPGLTRDRQVLALDLQAHGRTADIDRPMRFESLADDISAFLHHLDIPQTDVLGYSMGAGVALRTAIQHPHLVRKLVVVSFPFQSAGFFPDIAAQQKQLGPHLAASMTSSPMYQLYSGLAPRVEDWPRLVGRLGELMGREFDWTDELGGIQARVMLLVGDADMLPPAHAAQFFALLGGGHSDGHWNRSGMTKHRLAILPGTTHYDILQSPLLLPSIAPFLADE